MENHAVPPIFGSGGAANLRAGPGIGHNLPASHWGSS